MSRKEAVITPAPDARDHTDEFWTPYRTSVIVITSIIFFFLVFVMLIGYLCLRLVKIAQQNQQLERGKYSSIRGYSREISGGGYSNSGQEIEMSDVRMTLYQQTLNKYESDPELTYIWRTTPRYPESPRGYGAMEDPPALPPPRPVQESVTLGREMRGAPPMNQSAYPWTLPRENHVNVVSGSTRHHTASRDDYLVIVVDDPVSRL